MFFYKKKFCEGTYPRMGVSDLEIIFLFVQQKSKSEKEHIPGKPF